MTSQPPKILSGGRKVSCINPKQTYEFQGFKILKEKFPSRPITAKMLINCTDETQISKQ